MSIKRFSRASADDLLGMFAQAGDSIEKGSALDQLLEAFSGNDAGRMEFASAIGLDRLIRKEVSLGSIRNFLLPDTHIGLAQIAPFLEVATDEVVFDYLPVATDGLAPARAEDAEAELSQKDEAFAGTGRASVIDWSTKDRYAPSDVNRYREASRILEIMQGQGGNLPIYVTSALEDWATKLAKDEQLRKRKLDNRLELLIMTALSAGVIAYNDGKIKFTVDYGRPASQSNGNAANDFAPHVVDGVWDVSTTTHDPIGFFLDIKQFFFDTYGIVLDRVLTTKAVSRKMVNSAQFSQRAGLGARYDPAGAPQMPNLHYLLDGWGPQAALDVITNATGIEFVIYDSVYRTRPVGSNTVTSNRFFPNDEMVFLPSAASVSEFDDTDIGFAKTLTSPHPEGNWEPGFYEWEKSRTDPWGYDKGNGIKAFPVYPHMEYTYAVNAKLT